MRLKRLEQTRDRMAKYFDAKRQEPPGFKKGDKVMLDGRNLRTKRPSKKLDHKLYGPFKIIELIGNRAARLQLPPSMKCHNVFHFALLEPYRENQIQGRCLANPDPGGSGRPGRVRGRIHHQKRMEETKARKAGNRLGWNIW